MRKRKLRSVHVEDVESPIEAIGTTERVAVPQENAVAAVVGEAQSNEAFHPKYLKELHKIYKKVSAVMIPW